MKISLLCGGPSLERGISLNSARSVLDHLEDENIEIVPFYFDFRRKAYKISKKQLYSNTPSDFDFKLHNEATPLTEQSLINHLRDTDLVFPVMHGHFGEDGTIQHFLENHKIPYVGTSSEVCKIIFDKYKANQKISKLGFYTLPSVVLKIYHNDHKQIVNDFFLKNKIKRAIVKPASGGSSIGVFSVSTTKEALEKTELIFSKRMDTRVVIEPFAQGKEFTVIILQNRFNLPVAILPTEIETDYLKHQIFDFRKKYLPTRQVTYHCPPRFSYDLIEKIQVQAEQLFGALGFRDFARFDGWVFDDGQIWFSDFNPISGMEQNSFLFQQSSRVGLSHSGVLQYIIKHACKREKINFPESLVSANKKRKPINVLFGGRTSERQVSLMSGTNVWLKLRKSEIFDPKPFLLDTKNNIWELPYPLTLNHTVEEIADNCERFARDEERLRFLENKVRLRLGLVDQEAEPLFEPKKTSLAEFIQNSSFIFNALHGGEGESGVFQGLFSKYGVKYNGPNEKVSKLCADKFATSNFIKSLDLEGTNVARSTIISVDKLLRTKDKGLRRMWLDLRKQLLSKTLIIKPREDGCSTGIAHLYSTSDLRKYVEFLRKKASFIPKGTFHGQVENIEMPIDAIKDILFETFIETDIVKVKGNKLKHFKKTGWIEVTIGVIEENKKILVFNPSLTVAEGEVLTLEEKFQSGTGINITPPPKEIVKPETLDEVKKRVAILAEKVGIEGYSRIDAFMNTRTGDLKIIEINTLPGLTPSTVFFHQALAEIVPIYPRELIEKLIINKL